MVNTRKPTNPGSYHFADNRVDMSVLSGANGTHLHLSPSSGDAEAPVSPSVPVVPFTPKFENAVRGVEAMPSSAQAEAPVSPSVPVVLSTPKASGIIMHTEILNWVKETLDDKLRINTKYERMHDPYLVAILQEVDKGLKTHVLAHEMFYKVWEYKKGVKNPRDEIMPLFSLPDFTPVRRKHNESTLFFDLENTFYKDKNGKFLRNSADVVFGSSLECINSDENVYNDIGVRCIVMKGKKTNLKWYNFVEEKGEYACFKHKSLLTIEPILITIQESIRDNDSNFRRTLNVGYDKISTPLTLDELLERKIGMRFSREVNYRAKKFGQGKLFCDSMTTILAAAQHIRKLKSTGKMTLNEAVSKLVVVYFGAGQPNPNSKTHHLADVLRFFPNLSMIMYDTNEMDFKLNEHLLKKDVPVSVKGADGNYAATVVSVKENHVVVKRNSNREQERVHIADVELERVIKRYKMITEFGAKQLADELRKKGLYVVMISDIRSGVADPILENDIARAYIAKIRTGKNRSSTENTIDIQRIERLKSHVMRMEGARAQMVFNDMIFQMQISDILETSGLLVYSSIKIATDYQDLSDPKKIVYLPKKWHIRLQPFIPSTEMRAGKFYTPKIKQTKHAANWNTKTESSDNSAPIKGTEYIFQARQENNPKFYVETTLLDFSAPAPEDYPKENVRIDKRRKRLYLIKGAPNPKNRANVLRVNDKYYRPCFPEEADTENGLRELLAKDVDNALMYIHSVDRTHAGCNNAPIRLMLMLYHRYTKNTQRTQELIDHVNKQHMDAIRRAVKHIDHNEIDDYLMSSGQEIPTFVLQESEDLKPRYLEDSIKTYNDFPQATEILDMREEFLNIILSAEQMPKDKLRDVLEGQKSKLLARIWLHINDQFRFFTHACYENLKQLVKPPQLADLPGSTGTLTVQNGKKRRSMCIDWYCYWLHNLEKIAYIQGENKMQALFRNMSNVLVKSYAGQPLKLDLGLQVHQHLHEWPVSKPVFFVAISHGLLPMVELCFHDAEMQMLSTESKTEIMEKGLNKAGYTYYPLPYAVYYATRPETSAERAEKCVGIIKWMLENCDFDVNKPNTFSGRSETALDIAIDHKDAEVVHILLSDVRTKPTDSNLMSLQTMASTDNNIDSLLPKRDKDYGKGTEQANTQRHDSSAVHDPTGNDLDDLISARNTEGLTNAFKNKHIKSPKQLDEILAIALEQMDKTLVALAVMYGAHTNDRQFFDQKFSSAVPRDKLWILLYLACANFHRKKSQTFSFTSTIIDRMESLSGEHNDKTKINSVNLRKFCEDQFVVITIHGELPQKKKLIEWALYAEDYFAVGRLMNMKLSVEASQQTNQILRLVLEKKCAELESHVSEFSPKIKTLIATGYACNEAVRVAIGNYKNNEVMRALNVTALAIATYLKLHKFDIVLYILHMVPHKIEYIDSKLAVPWNGRNMHECSIATVLTKLFSEIPKNDKNKKSKLKDICSQLKENHQLQI
jgi:hypothetical protein